MKTRCFACDRPTGNNPRRAVTEDGRSPATNGQTVFVGSDCYKKIGPDGYQPPKGGPRLFRGPFVWLGVQFDENGKPQHGGIKP
jgi:hypothetical protein